MWWLDPGKEVLNVIFNRILAPYVENLDLNQVNYGIGQGRITLRDLRLKKNALDKFQLPIDVREGFLGTFTLSLHWMNLGNKPVEILIEDVYILAVPSAQSNVNPEEEASRVHAAKMERLENAELLHVRDQMPVEDDSPKEQGLWESLIAKIVNNVQITVKNIHVRYEDSISVPGHPFATGLTLLSFSAVSVNEQWQPAFIENTSGAVHKLARLQSFAIYFDTDSSSMAGLSREAAYKDFVSMISREDSPTTHQFILKPVSSDGRIIMNHTMDSQTPRLDIQLLLNEISIALDDHQYRDVISLADMYHVYLRQHQYRQFRHLLDDHSITPAKCRLVFAGQAILAGVRERRRQWTWPYFAERRDDRNAYVSLFQKRLKGQLDPADNVSIEALEHKLSYDDLRFYRSIARSRLKKDIAAQKASTTSKAQQPKPQGWISWAWGGTAETPPPTLQGEMTEEQRKQLYEVLDYDEKTALIESLQTAPDSLKARIAAKLNKGTFAIRNRHTETTTDILSVVFDAVQADFIQRPNNYEASISLVDLGVFDGTTTGTLHSKIVHVKDYLPAVIGSSVEPFFFVKFESNPLDERADTALTMRMRHMEIIYHRGYVEAVYQFFQPPESQLESVEALLNVASQTIEGFRKETRAGLEYALQTHKTVDIQLDMNAPVIIVPENVRTYNCTHLIIDAGHISIESNLANKEAVRTIRSKRNKKYDEEDYKQLESLMYDRFTLNLKAAQFIIGDNYESCIEALSSTEKTGLHLLERTSIDFELQNSIVPTAYNLARCKVSGNLPTLQVNFSDSKYKAIMRLIDIAIPKLGDDTSKASPPSAQPSQGFILSAPLFRSSHSEYTVADDKEKEGVDDSDDDGDEFFEAEDGTTDQHPAIHQHFIEFSFKVNTLTANLFRSDGVGEKLLGTLSLDGFSLLFSSTKFTMHVDVALRSLSMTLEQSGKRPIQFISSIDTDLPDNSAEDLLRVKYHRVQMESPDFLAKYEGIDQAADIQLSTIILRAAPEPLLFIYDFIMATFTSNAPNAQPSSGTSAVETANRAPAGQSNAGGKIRVLLKLAGVQVTLLRDEVNLATVLLSTADFTLLLRAKTMRVTGRLGGLSVSNDVFPTKPVFKEILSIEGSNLADFTYQTFDPDEESYAGIQSAITLHAASVKLNFLEEPLQAIYVFFLQFARLKGLYDAATRAAVESAPEISRMQFAISIKSPIICFPIDPVHSDDTFILRLGEMSAQNEPQALVNKIQASLHGIQLVSHLVQKEIPSTLRIIEDIDVMAEINQRMLSVNTEPIEPAIQVVVNVTDVRFSLTQLQYQLLLVLAQTIPRVLSVTPPEVPGEAAIIRRATMQEPGVSSPSATVNLQPELIVSPTMPPNGTNIDLLVSIPAINLQLYDGAATEQTLKEHGITRFGLTNNTLRFKMLFDGSMEAQVVLRSFTVNNLRPRPSRFKELIPAATHERNQFMLLYTATGGPGSTSLAVLTVDSPQILLALDPFVAVVNFFMNTGYETENQPSSSIQTTNGNDQKKLDFRIDLHDVSITILQDDNNPDSQAIRLSINQLLLSQQGITALTINRLGMSLLRMGAASESLRFLDDVDLTFSLDQRSTSAQQLMNIEVTAKPIIFRASYRDVNLITSIVNKAMELYAEAQKESSATKEQARVLSPTSAPVSSKVSSISQPPPTGTARVILSKEQLKGTFEGFHLVLIGDLHEQPLYHLKVMPFIIHAKDWSGELSAKMTLAMQTSYWNLTNSHWEPLIDPWTFTASVSRESPAEGTKIVLDARERLDLNISTTFIELSLMSLRVLSSEGQVLQKARGAYAPYRIRNFTGLPVMLWNDSSEVRDQESTISPGQSLDWRFDDWKTLREHIASSIQHSIGVQFIGKAWEPLRGVTVDREGEFVFTLRPRNEKYPDKLLCEIKVVDSVKIVTLRSTYKIENQTLYTLEVMLIDNLGRPTDSVQKVLPGHDFSLPIEAVAQGRIRLQPDQGFGYRWCSPIRREDLLAKQSFTVKCLHSDPKEAPFRFRASVHVDNASRAYSKLSLKLRAPLELENLLPYNIEYRIYDKDTDQNWRSFLRKGGIMPVHSIELDHFVLLNITIQDTVFRPSEFAIINNDGQGEFDIENRLVLQDESNRKLNVNLNYVRYTDAGGAFKVQIYSPFVVINKTGLPFSVKTTRSTRPGSQDVAGDSRSSALATSTPFLLSHPHPKGHEFLFKVDDSLWSKPCSVEAISAESTLTMASAKNRGEEFQVGLSWAEGSGKYKLTKVVTLTPRFILVNKLAETISFREHGVAPRDNSMVASDQRCPLNIFKASQEKLLTIAFPGLNAQWSAPVNIEDLGLVHLRLRAAGTGPDIRLIRVNIKVDASTIFIYLEDASEGWPFLIENDSDAYVEFGQTDTNDDKQSTKGNPLYALRPKTTEPYAWDFPAVREKKLLLIVKGARRIMDVMEIGSLPPFRYLDGQRLKALSLDVRADGHRQILRISDYNSARSVYRPRERSYSGTLTRQDTLNTLNSGEVFEAVSVDYPMIFTFNLQFAGIGISLINRKTVEVVYISVTDLKLDYFDNPLSQAINISFGTLQVDNQLHDAIYPVIIQPTPIPKDRSGIAALPTIQASITWLKDQAHGVFFIKYCSLLLQALTIEVDEDLLYSLYDLTQIKGAFWEADASDHLTEHPTEVPEPKDTTTGSTLYFEVFELQPIMLALSFMTTERVSSGEPLSLHNPLAVVVNALTMTLGNVNDAPLELNALAIKDMRLTLPDLQSRVIYHYRQDIIRQLYRILGSADFIGNPVGLFTNVSSGVADIFYEPYHGVVMHGNRELGIGFAKGAASFLKKTVFGLSDSVTKFTSSVGKGLSAATFDSEYQARRRLNQRRNRPRHAIYGVAAGGEALASSVTSAVEGVLMKPLEGAEAEGALGFFKGVGKGLVGVVTKPVVGVFDLASNVSEGIRNTTTVFDSPERERVRLPRQIPSDGVLKSYSAREAMGQYWMKDLDNGTYRSEFYVAHINSPGSDNVILLTTARVLSFWSKKLRIEWDLPFTHVQGVSVEDTGIRFAHKNGRDQDKFALVPDKEAQSWFFGQVAAVVKAFNARRRMDS